MIDFEDLDIKSYTYTRSASIETIGMISHKAFPFTALASQRPSHLCYKHQTI